MKGEVYESKFAFNKVIVNDQTTSREFVKGTNFEMDRGVGKAT